MANLRNVSKDACALTIRIKLTKKVNYSGKKYLKSNSNILRKCCPPTTTLQSKELDKTKQSSCLINNREQTNCLPISLNLSHISLKIPFSFHVNWSETHKVKPLLELCHHHTHAVNSQDPLFFYPESKSQITLLAVKPQHPGTEKQSVLICWNENTAIRRCSLQSWSSR